MIRKPCSVLLVILLVAACSAAYSAEKIRVLNPTPPNRMVDRVPLAPRLASLEGKTLFLVDIGWGGENAAPSVYAEMKAWFAKNMPSVKTVLRTKSGTPFSDSPELWAEIQKEAYGAVFGVGG